MLLAIVAAIDKRDAEVNHFVEPALERFSYTGVEGQKILQHIRAMSQRLLCIARFAAQSFFINLFYFRSRVLSFNQRDACHDNLTGNKDRTPYNKAAGFRPPPG